MISGAEIRAHGQRVSLTKSTQRRPPTRASYRHAQPPICPWRAVLHRCTQGGPLALAILLEVRREEECVYLRNVHSAQLSGTTLRWMALLNVSTRGGRVLGGKWRLGAHERAMGSFLVHMARVLGALCVWLYTVSGP